MLELFLRHSVMKVHTIIRDLICFLIWKIRCFMLSRSFRNRWEEGISLIRLVEQKKKIYRYIYIYIAVAIHIENWKIWSISTNTTTPTCGSYTLHTLYWRRSQNLSILESEQIWLISMKGFTWQVFIFQVITMYRGGSTGMKGVTMENIKMGEGKPTKI